MQRDPDNGTVTFTETHAVVKYPRRRGTQVAEILGRVPAKDDAPELIYLRTRLHSFDSERFNEAGAGCWSATGAISTVLVAAAVD
jgi:hypothetical protein